MVTYQQLSASTRSCQGCSTYRASLTCQPATMQAASRLFVVHLLPATAEQCDAHDTTLLRLAVHEHAMMEASSMQGEGFRYRAARRRTEQVVGKGMGPHQAHLWQPLQLRDARGGLRLLRLQPRHPRCRLRLRGLCAPHLQCCMHEVGQSKDAQQAQTTCYAQVMRLTWLLPARVSCTI